MKFKDLIEEVKDGEIGNKDTLAKPKVFTTQKALEKSVDLGGQELKATLGGGFSSSLSLINRTGKEELKNDPEGVVLKPKYDTKELDRLLDSQPICELEDDTAYLRYQLGLEAELGVGGDYSLVGLEFDAEVDWSASYYSKHSFERGGEAVTIGDAILSDLGVDLGASSSGQEEQSAIGSVVGLFDEDPLTRMNEGDVITFAAGGSIGGSISVDAGELLSGSIAYSGLFKEAIPVKYNAGFKLTASVKFTGDHFIGIGATGPDQYTVVVRRASSTLTGFGAQLGASVEVDFTETVKVINGYLSLVTALPRAEVDELRGKIDDLIDTGLDGVGEFVDGLGVNEISALSKLYDDFIDDRQGELSELLDEKSALVFKPLVDLEAFLKEWSAKLKKYAKVKLELAFGLQYSRLGASADLLRLTCSASAFAQVRSSLMAFKLDVEALNGQAGVEVQRFLNVKLEKVTGQVGLLLTVGSWSFGSKVSGERQWVAVRDRKQNDKITRVSYYGTRSYLAKEFKDSAKYTMSFEATTNPESTISGNAPTLRNLDYTISVASSFTEKKMSERDLRQFLDCAAIYGAASADVDSNLTKLSDLGLKTNATTQVQVGISVAKSAALDVIQRLAEPSHELFAKAMAMAMFMTKGEGSFYRGRKTIQQRLDVYEPVWMKLLTQGNTNQAKAFLGAELDKYNFEALKIWEGGQFKKTVSNNNGGSSSPLFQSMANITNTKPRYLGDLEESRAAFRVLHKALSGAGPDWHYSKLAEIHEGVSEAWEYSYACRLFASLVHLAVESVSGINKNEVEFVFKLTQGTETYEIPKV